MTPNFKYLWLGLPSYRQYQAISSLIPRQPVCRLLQGLPRFVVTRGGEYFFAPGLRASRWLAALET